MIRRPSRGCTNARAESPPEPDPQCNYCGKDAEWNPTESDWHRDWLDRPTCRRHHGAGIGEGEDGWCVDDMRTVSA